ncbi:MAG: lysozyme [Gallionella sp.]|nr:lysozyme [Gallionella sp.]
MDRKRSVIAGIVLSASALVAIVTSEGYTDTAVIPVPGDVPTIGFGTTEGVKPGDRITPPRALARALTDVQKYEGALKRCVTVPLHQHEYDAYVSLAYNIGPGAFCGSTLVKRLNAGQYREACEQILVWNKFKGKPLRGLTLRRQSEYKTCMGPA